MERKNRGILKNKLFLYLTEFFSGMSVMAVELGASRLLAPYFSSSQIVWTIIIGTIMIAMALGNIYGGRTADKSPNPDKLYGRIIVAALWIALIPVVGKYIIVGISAVLIFSVNNNFLILAAFVACMVIFVFPLFLLGTVTPSLVKYSVSNLDDNGKTVGTLGAFNTIGSIIGTFVPTFVTIPAVGTSITFLIFAGILLALSIVYFVMEKAGKKKVIASVLIFAFCCGTGYSDSFAFWENNLTYEGESVYNYLQVYENDERVALSTNVLFGVQSVYMKQDELTGMYYDYAMAAPLMLKDKPTDQMDVLILGMGTGTYATQCRKYFGDMNIEGVEIDEKITDLSRKYFSLSEDVPVTTYDGRAFLNASQKAYDVIMVDAYQEHHNSIPDVLERVLCAGEIASEGRWRHGGKYEYARNERGKHQSVPFRYDWKCLYYRGYRRCGGIIQPGTLCVGRSGHRKESDEAYRRTYKCKSEKYDAGSCFKSYRISKRKLYPHR